MENSIDIIVPYWGEFSLLKQTVDSVLAQTSKAWHLTIAIQRDSGYLTDHIYLRVWLVCLFPLETLGCL